MREYRLTVRRQQGIGSNWLHAARPGTNVRLRSPNGEFVLDTGSVRPVALIAAGIGITPLFAMLQAHLTRGAKHHRSISSMALARRTCHVPARAGRDRGRESGRAHSLRYSRSDAGGRPAGRITSELVTQLLSDLHVMFGDRRIPLPWYESDFYLCGPGDFCMQLNSS